MCQFSEIQIFCECYHWRCAARKGGEDLRYVLSVLVIIILRIVSNGEKYINCIRFKKSEVYLSVMDATRRCQSLEKSNRPWVMFGNGREDCQDQTTIENGY